MTARAHKTAGDRSVLWDAVLFIGGVALLLGLLVQAFAQQVGPTRTETASEAIGKLVGKSNEVRRRPASGVVWDALGSGASLFQKDTVFVGPDSEAVVALNDGSKLSIDEKSLVVIEQSRAASAGLSVTLLKGSASGQVTTGALALVTAGGAVALGQGSRARVRVGPDKSAQVDVSKGKARLAAEQGAAVDLGEGQRSSLDPDTKQVGAVLDLNIELTSPAPGQRIFSSGPEAAVTFGWWPKKGRGTYIFELSNDAQFESIAITARTRKPQHRQKLGPGMYYWRVRRSDQLSEERKLIVIEDQPPIIYQPRADEATNPSVAPAFLAWNRVRDVPGYVVQVAKEGGFDSLIVNERVERPSHPVPDIPQGGYCARVRTNEPDREATPWSQPRCFRVIERSVLRPPKVFQPKRERLPQPKGVDHETVW